MQQVDRVHRQRHVRAPLAADDRELCEGAERERVGDLAPRLQLRHREVAIEPPDSDIAQAVELVDDTRQLTRLRVLRIDQAGVHFCSRRSHLGGEEPQLFGDLLHRRRCRRRRERRRARFRISAQPRTN